jgi:hypothetical protein
MNQMEDRQSRIEDKTDVTERADEHTENVMKEY